MQRDQSGAEALVVAYETPYGNLRKLFEVGIKPHVFVAMHRFAEFWGSSLGLDMGPYIKADISELPKLPEWKRLADAIKNDERRYMTGKTLCHASNYGIEANAFKEVCLKRTDGQLVLSTKDASELLAFYHGLFKELLPWHDRVRAELKATRTLRNLFGHPRLFTGTWSDKFVKEAIAFVPQSTVGMITNYAVLEFQEYIETNNRDWHIFNNKHDSFAAIVPLAEHLEALKVMATFIERDLTSTTGNKFKMRSEGQMGLNWAKFHETKNPQGMKEVKGV